MIHERIQGTMARAQVKAADEQSGEADGHPTASGGSQTLLRGLDVLEAVAEGPIALAELARNLGLNRSTTHRLASALVDRRYLTFIPRLGYSLGPKLIQLGFNAQDDIDVVRLARPHIEALATATEDTVHLGVREGDRALYLDKIPGQRRVDISSRIGERQPLTCTGLGKALLLDEDDENWSKLFKREQSGSPRSTDYELWRKRMRNYVSEGYAFDLEENEDLIRCVAAPIRDAGGRIVAAISLSSAAQYMNDDRMAALTGDVRVAAEAISSELGWTMETKRLSERPHRIK
ncbi:MAG TPA: IclR family transcriptional regulator [Sphingomicrobium sp.]|jgi:DNA-binding IclR family transcriptional regulator